jgi:hypothetical protein
LQDIVEVMAPTYTMGLHDVDTSTRWTTSDVMCYFVSAATAWLMRVAEACLALISVVFLQLLRAASASMESA